MIRISEGDLNQHLDIHSNDEIGDMARTFNFMTRGLQEKAIIESFSRELGFSVELDKICQLIIQRIVQGLSSKQGYLFLRSSNQSAEPIYQLQTAFPHGTPTKIQCHIETSLRNYLSTINHPVLLNVLHTYTEFISALQPLPVLDKHSLVCPLMIKQEVVGLLILDGSDSNTAYSEEEKSFLRTLLGQGAFAIESALLYEELTEQERLKRELEIAKNVQERLLPQTAPAITGVEIAGICIPATEIGGDYFDWFPVSDDKTGIVIADVTGKGTSAAFYMAMIKGMMLSLTQVYMSPRKLLIELNRRLFGTIDSNIFVTMIYAVLDSKRRTITFARAGHNALLYRPAETRSTQMLVPGGIGLGLEKGDVFQKTLVEEKRQLHAGDVVVLYTDGISEAMDEQQQEFGDNRLADIITQANSKHAQDLVDETLKTVQDFVGVAPQHDDMTMIVIAATSA